MRLVHLVRVLLLTVAVCFVGIAVIETTSCAHRQGTTVPVTPWEQVMVNNSMVATANNGVLEAVINLNQANLLAKDVAGRIVTYQGKIAADHIQLTKILNQGQSASLAQADTINGLLKSMQDATNQMVASGNINVVNPNTQVSLQAQVTSIGGFLQSLTTSLKGVGVLK